MPALRHAYWARILGRHNGKQYCHYACPRAGIMAYLDFSEFFSRNYFLTHLGFIKLISKRTSSGK